MGAWVLFLYTAASGTPLPLGHYNTEAACYEAVVALKFDIIERHGFDRLPNLSCVRMRR